MRSVALLVGALGLVACAGAPETRCTAAATCGPTASCAMGACVRHELASTTGDARRVIAHAVAWATLESATGGARSTRADTLRVGNGATSLLRFRWPRLLGARSIVGAWLELSPDVAAAQSSPRGELTVMGVEQPWRASRLVPRTSPVPSGVALAIAPVDVRHERVRVDLLSSVRALLRGTTASEGLLLARRGGGDAWEFVSPAAGDPMSRPRIVLLVR